MTETATCAQGFWSATALPPQRSDNAAIASVDAHQASQQNMRSLLWVEQDVEPKVPERAPRNVIKGVLRRIQHKEMVDFYQVRTCFAVRASITYTT